MSRFPDQFGVPQERPYVVRTGDATGTLVSFFNAVYAWMACGLALTAAVAWWISRDLALVEKIFSPGLLLVLVLAELGLVWVIAGAINKINAAVATLLFMVYSALNGLTLSVIFLAYTQSSIFSAFAITAGTFAAMSLYGMVTKTDLTKIGSLLIMALFGLIIASVVNLFMHSTMLVTLINYAGVLIFVGLTAYDTQKLKYIAVATAGNAALSARLSVSGALSLYLDFINLFLFILRIMGSRRD